MADRVGSAGVGRTGSFIVVDAVLDALRWDHNHPSATAATSSRPPPRPLPTLFSTSSHAAVGERPIATPHHPVERMSEISTIPDMGASTADATDKQYQADSFAQHRSRAIPSTSSTGEAFPRVPSFGSASSATGISGVGTGTSGLRSQKSTNMADMYVLDIYP